MIVTRRIAIRIGADRAAHGDPAGLLLLLLSILGATPNVVPVVIVCARPARRRACVGAVCGFVAGLLLDSLLLQTLGVSSLVLLSIGYLAGRYREGFEITSSLVPPLLAGGFTLLAAAGFAAIELMLGVEAPVSLLVVREIVVQGLLAILLAIAVYPLIRRILAPALVDYTPAAGCCRRLRRPRRRRGGGAGGAASARSTGRARPARRRAPTAPDRRRDRLMYDGGDWRRPPVPAQFALRVAVLGGVGLVLFAIIFLRLWYLEVLSGDQYMAEAENNQVREFTVQAPRGEILDRQGKSLVENRTALALQVKPTDLPAQPRAAGGALRPARRARRA